MQTKTCCGFVVTFVEKLFVILSITLNADSVAPKVSFEPSFVC